MHAERSFTLADLAERLGVAQHRLIHLCEKGVAAPDLQDASGRGSSRVFSSRNVLELAVALRLRDMMLPVSAVQAILQVLRTFEGQLERELPGFSLPESLRDEGAPDLRIVLSDGRSIFFSLGVTGAQAKLFGGISVEDAIAGERGWDGKLRSAPGSSKERASNGADPRAFGGPERSRFARLELSVTEVARDLPID